MRTQMRRTVLRSRGEMPTSQGNRAASLSPFGVSNKPAVMLPIVSLSGTGRRFTAVGVAGISGALRVQHGRCPGQGLEGRSRVMDEV